MKKNKLFNNSTKAGEIETAPQTKRKFFKTLGFASLAIFMGATGIFAFAPLANTPILPNTLNASASTESQNFDLGLRPDTDPVVYVTESGLEIKKSNGKYTSTTTTTTNNGTTRTQDLRNFYYFTMGTYTGTIYTGVGGTTSACYNVSNEPVNWLILARGSGFEFSDNTPAGTSIKTDNPKQEFAITPGGYLPMDMQAIPEDPADEIPNNCFLVLSEKLINIMYFNSSGAVNTSMLNSNSEQNLIRGSETYYGNRYRFKSNNSTGNNGGHSWTTSGNVGGSLYNYINSLFSKNTSGTILENDLGFTQAQADLIIPQQLYTYYSNGSGYNYAETPSTDGGTYYTMFPLAYRAEHTATKQTFCIEDYLPNANQRTAVLIGSNYSFVWWLRTGGIYNSESSSAKVVTTNGSIGSNCQYYSHNSMGVRPAFVLKVME